MASQRNRPARLVDTQAGTEVYASTCNQNSCDVELISDGRLVDMQGSTKILAVASECCQPPTSPSTAFGIFDDTCNDAASIVAASAVEPFLVERDHYPPYGLSRVIRVTLVPVLGCIEKGCLTGYLIYDDTPATNPAPCDAIPSGYGAWTGCIGTVVITLWVTDADPPGVKVCVSGCVDTGSYDVIVSICTLGASLQVDAQIPADDCCDCVNSNSLLGIYGKSFCGPYRQGRLVDTISGTKVFVIGDCCEEECTAPDQDCCTVLEGCDLVATVAVTGCCDGLAGSHTLTFSGGGGNPLFWSFSYPSAICDRNWHIEITCDVPDPINFPYDATMTIDFYSSTVGGDCGMSGTATTTVPIPQPCYPLEVVFNDLDFFCDFAEEYIGDRCIPTGVTVTISL